MDCPACGANVQVGVDVADHTTRVVLEPYEDSSSEFPRYRVVGFGPPLQVERVPADAPGSFYPIHHDCPSYQSA